MGKPVGRKPVRLGKKKLEVLPPSRRSLAHEMPVLSLIGKESMAKLLAAKEAALYEMQKEYRDSMAHLKIEETIDNHFFPELLRGMARYLEARTRKTAGTIPAAGDEIYLSEGFDEHMRNWQQAIKTNYRGASKDIIENYFQLFYNSFHAHLKKMIPAPSHSLLLPE